MVTWGRKSSETSPGDDLCETVILIILVSSISPDNRDRLFSKLDKDENGKIDLDEFRALFKK